jgi:hypothetical protein
MDFRGRWDWVRRPGSYSASAVDGARRGIRTPDRLIKSQLLTAILNRDL